MHQLESEYFQFGGRQFEIRRFAAEAALTVTVMLDGRQVGPVYFVDYAAIYEYSHGRQQRLMANLTWLARLDVEMGMCPATAAPHPV